MEFNLIYSDSEIISKIDAHLASASLQWSCFDSSRKDLRRQRVNDIYQSIWGQSSCNPFALFWNWAWKSIRMENIKQILRSDLFDRKLTKLESLQEKIKLLRTEHRSSEQITKTLRGDDALKIFSSKDLSLLVHPLPRTMILKKSPAQTWSKLNEELQIISHEIIIQTLDAIDASIVKKMNDGDIVKEIKEALPRCTGFDDHELYLLIFLRRNHIEIGEARDDWNAYKAAAYHEALHLRHIDFESHIEPIIGWTKEMMSEVERDFHANRVTKNADMALSAVLQLQFAPDLMKTLPEHVQAFLSRLEKSPNFDRYMTEGIDRQFTDKFQAYAEENGAWIQATARDPSSNKNAMHPVAIGKGLTYSILNSIRTDQVDRRGILQVAFHRADGSASAHISPKHTEEFANECLHFQDPSFLQRIFGWKKAKEFDPAFHLLLQRLLQQDAFTSIVGQIDGAFKEMLGSQNLTINSRFNQSLKADVYSLPNGSVRIDYQYESPRCSSDLSDHREIGLYTMKFSYWLERNSDTNQLNTETIPYHWNIKGPVFQPIRYSRTSLK